MPTYKTALEQRILDFFNNPEIDEYDIRFRIKADPDFGRKPASGYGITLDTAKEILSRRTVLGGMFSALRQIDAINRVGPVTMHNILYSFSEYLRAWMSSEDGQRVASRSDVGIGTLVPEQRLEVYDGDILTRAFLATPVLVTTLGITGEASDLFVLGTRAYVAAGTAGLQVVDISDPVAPALMGGYNTDGKAEGVYVADNLVAYIADGAEGLQVIDVSKPAKPKRLGGYKTGGYASGVWVVGDIAYLADGASKGLQIFDVSNPAAPAPVRSIGTGGTAEDVYVAGNYAYVANGEKGLQVIDVDPLNPLTLVSEYDTHGFCRCAFVHGDRVYVADDTYGFRIIDISNPLALDARLMTCPFPAVMPMSPMVLRESRYSISLTWLLPDWCTVLTPPRTHGVSVSPAITPSWLMPHWAWWCTSS